MTVTGILTIGFRIVYCSKKIKNYYFDKTVLTLCVQEKGMWIEALKSCREYLPAKLDELQAEYDRECGARVTRDINSLFVQAGQWEQNGEFKTAVDCLLKVKKIYIYLYTTI